ncbi:MAG: DUF542 domain-containing protein [Fibrobacteria bacterium]
MSIVNKDMTVEEIIARFPPAGEVFETVGIDYCCGGKSTLEMACKVRGINVSLVLDRLDKQAGPGPASATPEAFESLSASALADHIEQTHHQPLWSELDRLDALSAKVARVHGAKEPRLTAVREVFLEFAHDLSEHMVKEERILFPLIRSLESSRPEAGSHCGSVVNPIRQMESDHEQAEAALVHLRELTDGYKPPDYACFSYRSLLTGLEHMEADLREYMRKESLYLFPKAVELERAHA